MDGGGRTSTRSAEGTPEENYSIAIPPPNVTGALHMGHALNGSIQDVLIRTNRMHGRNDALDPRHRPRRHRHPGGGREEAARRGHRRHELGREEFVERVWEWKEEYGGTIVEQFKRLGASCDYERERFTLDEGYVERRLPRLRRSSTTRATSTATTTWSTGTRARTRRSPTSRSRTARSTDTLYCDRLPARGHGPGADRRHRAPGDDARRHRGRGQPRRRALRATSSASTVILPLVGRRAPDHRRRARRPRVRHRGAEDHPRPRPQRLRDRPQPRARGDRRDRRGRAA